MLIDAKTTAATPANNLSRSTVMRAGAWQDYLRLHRQGAAEAERIVHAASAAARHVAELRKVTADFFAQMDAVAGRI